MTKKLQDSTSMNTSMGSNINMNANNGKSSKKKKSTAPFVTETNPFVNHSRTNLNASKPPAHQKIEPKLPTNETPVVKKPREEDTMSRATSHGSHLNYTRAYSNRSMSKQSMLSGATVRTEYSNKILNLELLKPKPKPEPQKFTTDANPFVNSSRNMLNSAESKTSINEKKKLDITQQSQDPVMQKINTWQMKNKELNSSSDRLQASYSHIDAPFVTNQSAMNITRSEIGSPFPKDITKSDIGFMMAEPFENRFSLYMKNTLTKLNVLIFLFFLVVLIILLVSLISPYWLVMKEPWIERFLIPKQYILDPEKTNAWIGLFSSCNTENRCASGTPYDDRGWYVVCKILFPLGYTLMLMAFVVECVYVCCMAYVLVPTFKLVYLAAILIFVGAICCTVSVAMYGASCLSDGLLTPMSLNGPGGLLTWGYFLGIVSTSLSYLVALLFAIDASIQATKVKNATDAAETEA